MKTVDEIRSVVKAIIQSSPFDKTLLSRVERDVFNQEGIDLKKFARVFGFPNVIEMIESWKPDILVVGSGLNTSLRVETPDYIAKMNLFTKATDLKKKYMGFNDIIKSLESPQIKTDSYGFLANSSSSSSFSQVASNLITSTSIGNMNQSVITDINKKIAESRSLDITKPIVIRLLDGINPFRFWFIAADDYVQLNKLMTNMTDFYNKDNELTITPTHLKKGLYVAVRYAKLWHRGLILEVFSEENVRVLCVDFGSVETVEANQTRYLLKKYFDVPCLAQRGTISHVQPTNGKWSDKSILFFKESLHRRLIDAKVFKKIPEDSSYQMAIKVNIGESKEKILLTEAMIEKGEWCEFDPEFLEKDSLSSEKFSFVDYEAGKHLPQPIIEEENWLPKAKTNSQVDNKLVKSSEVMKTIFESNNSGPLTHRRRKIEIADAKRKTIVDQSLNELKVGSVHKVYVHVVRGTDEFYFFLMSEFEKVRNFLSGFNEMYFATRSANDDFSVGTDVVTYADQNYCRCRIVKVLEDDSFELLLLDFGLFVQRPKEEIFKLYDEFKDRQAAVFRGKLSNVPEHFFLKTREDLLAKVRNRVIEIKVKQVHDNVCSLLLINP